MEIAATRWHRDFGLLLVVRSMSVQSSCFCSALLGEPLSAGARSFAHMALHYAAILWLCGGSGTPTALANARGAQQWSCLWLWTASRIVEDAWHLKSRRYPYPSCQVIEDGMAKKGGEGGATNHTRHCLLLACIAIADMGCRPSGKGCLFAMS
jgi:hypothetical protein